MLRPLLCATALALLSHPVVATAPALATAAEQSGFQRTGRYDEVIDLCKAFQKAFPAAVRCQTFGRTPEGRPMQVLVVSQSGALTPEAAQRRKLPVLLVQGGIHAGEIDGKDAGFLALRQLLRGDVAAGALKAQVLLFVPVFSVDGHERFKAWNRPNQSGPEEMGWRTTAQNYNLNRDYAKADAPEMQAMLQLVRRWDPLLTIDLHVTDGAKFEHDVAIQVEPLHVGDPALMAAGKSLSAAVRGELAEQGSLPLDFYPSFVEGDNPASGVVDSIAPPRFSTGYFHLRNRFAMLVETHSWKDYPTRVRITRNTIVASVRQIAAHGAQWRAAALVADARAAALGGAEVALDYRTGERVRTIAFRGYAYTRTPSAVSGALVTRYDDQTPQLWSLPLRDDIQPATTVIAPAGGYLVPAAHAGWVSAKLAAHGIRFEVVSRPAADQAVEEFRAQTATFAAGSVEGHQRLTVTGDWNRAAHAVGAGSLFVPIQQPLARLVIALLEPRAPDSLLAWGGFNNAFEQKEYMEDYVAEVVAEQMLAADPALAAEFAGKLADDPAFAASAQARLQFFYQRHPSWDQRLNLYPVLRIAQRPSQ